MTSRVAAADPMGGSPAPSQPTVDAPTPLPSGDWSYSFVPSYSDPSRVSVALHMRSDKAPSGWWKAGVYDVDTLAQAGEGRGLTVNAGQNLVMRAPDFQQVRAACRTHLGLDAPHDDDYTGEALATLIDDGMSPAQARAHLAWNR